MGGINLCLIPCSVIPSGPSGLSAHGRSEMNGESYFLSCSGLVLSSESPHSCGLLECWGTDAPPQRAFNRQRACQTSAVFLLACLPMLFSTILSLVHLPPTALATLGHRSSWPSVCHLGENPQVTSTLIFLPPIFPSLPSFPAHPL